MFHITQATEIRYANEFFQSSSEVPKVNLEKFTNFKKVNNDFFRTHDIRHALTILKIQKV